LIDEIIENESSLNFSMTQNQQ